MKFEEAMQMAKEGRVAVSPTGQQVINALLKEINRLETAHSNLNKELTAELRDPSGTIWEHAKKLQDENDRLKEDINKIFAKES